MLKRYWLILCPGEKYGPKNSGITASSAEQAKRFAKDAIAKLRWTNLSDTLIEKAETIEDIDVRTLDENHVFPNMGVVSRQGIWFPNLTS